MPRLTFADGTAPGITRKPVRGGKDTRVKWAYFDPDGARIRDGLIKLRDLMGVTS